MVIKVLDSTDTEAILKDAGVETPGEQKEEKVVDTKATDKTASTAAEKKAVLAAATEDPSVIADDGEDEDGLTKNQKRELTDKMQKAIGKKHRMIREAEEFAAAQYSQRKLSDQRAENLQREIDTLKGQLTPVSSEKTKPQREDFKTDQEFLDAAITWGTEDTLKKRAQEEVKREEEREQGRIVETAKSRIAQAIELVPDFAEVTGSVDAEVPPAIAGYMQRSELFAELGYYLAKNPEMLLSLSKLKPDEQLVKIGRIEATLEPFAKSEKIEAKTNDSATLKETKVSTASKTTDASPSETETTPSKARSGPVITPLNGSGTAIEKDPKDMDIRETITDFSKRNQVNLGLRKRH